MKVVYVPQRKGETPWSNQSTAATKQGLKLLPFHRSYCNRTGALLVAKDPVNIV
jgi:hypothetical protein